MDKQKEIKGWAMYDWANSAFSTTVVTAFLGPYLTALIATRPNGMLVIGRYQIEAEAFYPFCVSVSVVLQVILLPFLGSLADYTNLKKHFMLSFAYTGAITTILLFFVQSQGVVWGGVLFVVANLSFGAAMVFYNAFLPEIASPAEQDAISSKGFAYGYVGGGLLLAVNLVLLHLLPDTGLAVRLSLASAGVWWLLFTWLYPHKRLVQRPMAIILSNRRNYITQGLHEFASSLRQMKHYHPLSLRYLIAYLIYNDGIQTVNTVAAIFATVELGLEPQQLVLIILMIQFIAALGAILFNHIARYIGAKNSVIVTLIGWSVLLVYGYAYLVRPEQIWGWAFAEALVLGSSQALSRSIFAKMVPSSHQAAYFSLYEISERGTSWIGPLVFGLAVQLSGSSRFALLPIITFFLFGIVILWLTDVRQAIADAGNEVPAIV